MSNAARTIAALLTTLLVALGASMAAFELAGSAPAGTPSAASPLLPNPHFVRLQVDDITPHVVTDTTTGPVTARGLVINDGDRDVRNVQVRLERSPEVQTESTLRTALRTEPTELATAGAFTTIAENLSPGETASFFLSLPLRGNLDNTLGISEPGVYPMAVNVNGTPEFGGLARLDIVHFLLPVLSVPPDPNASSRSSSSAAASGSAKPAPEAAPGLTVLWPLAARPALRPGPLEDPAVLADDELAKSFARGGRLDGLLSAVEQHTTRAADPTGAVAASLCLAVDPDLLVTAQAMVRGYTVAADGVSAKPGPGGPAAAAWLQRLRVLAQRQCVIAMPWAQADVNALSRAGLTGLQRTADEGARAQVASTLKLPPLSKVAWPGSNFLSERAAAELHAEGTGSVLVSSNGVATPTGTTVARSTGAVQLAGTALGAGLIDAPAATALEATGSGEDHAARLQDALGAIAWPAIMTAQRARSGQPPSSSVARSVLLAPPQVWNIDENQAQTLLAEITTLLRTRAAKADPLLALLGRAAASPDRAELDYPVRAATAEINTTTTDTVSALTADIDRFGAALTQDPQSGVSTDELLQPLRLGLLRGMSTDDGSAQDNSARNPDIDAVRAELGQLQNGVALQPPSGTYTLASTQSPLLLVVHNDLPVAVKIRLNVDAPPGVRATDIGVQELPARSSRQLQLPTSVSRTGQFAVDVALTTDNGQQLGQPTRLQVRSTAYGPATALATAGAALVLLVLVGRRLWHRFRGQPDRADDHPMGL